MHPLKKHLFALLVSITVIVGCSGSGGNSDTYLRFHIEDQHFELEHIIFGLTSLPKEGWQFVEIGQDVTKVNIVSAAPSASIQWRMKLTDPAALESRVIDLNDVNDPAMADPIAMFTLSDDINVFNSVESTITVTITKVSDDFVDGTFKGSGLSFVSQTKDAFKSVNVSGSYRAKIRR